MRWGVECFMHVRSDPLGAQSNSRASSDPGLRGPERREQIVFAVGPIGRRVVALMTVRRVGVPKARERRIVTLRRVLAWPRYLSIHARCRATGASNQSPVWGRARVDDHRKAQTKPIRESGSRIESGDAPSRIRAVGAEGRVISAQSKPITRSALKTLRGQVLGRPARRCRTTIEPNPGPPDCSRQGRATPEARRVEPGGWVRSKDSILGRTDPIFRSIARRQRDAESENCT
jgi:hypothetical protein